MQIGNDSLFIVKINSNFDKFFDMSDTTKFKAGDKFAILWFIPKTGLYAKGTVDTIEVSDIAQEARGRRSGSRRELPQTHFGHKAALIRIAFSDLHREKQQILRWCRKHGDSQ